MLAPRKPEFFDVEGIPVTLGALPKLPYCAAWDVDPPRAFNPESARRNGAPISEGKFKALVLSERAKARS